MVETPVGGRERAPLGMRDAERVDRLVRRRAGAVVVGDVVEIKVRTVDDSALLRRVSYPSLAVAGDQECYAPDSVVEELVTSFDRLEVVRLASVGHLPGPGGSRALQHGACATS